MTTDAPFPQDQPPPGPSLGPDSPRPDRRALWGAVMRRVRSLVLATVVGTALVGALDTHWMGMLLIAPCLGAFLAGVVALVDSEFPGEPASRRAVAYAFVAGVLLVPFGIGLVMLGTTGGTILMGLLVVGPFLIGNWMVEVATPAAQPDVRALGELLSALPTARLLQEWRATEDLLRSARNHAIAAEVRALLLDELSRRDPEGVTAWLAAGRGSPGDFIRSDRDLAG